MSKIFCKYCGTEYTTDVAKCPLCGASNVPHVADGFAFLDQDDEFEATGKPAADSDVKVYGSDETKEQPARNEPKAPPAAMPIYEKKPAPAAAPKMAQKEEKRKSGNAVKIVVILLLVAALLAAVFFAAKATGLFDRKEPGQEEDESLDLPVDDTIQACTGITLDLTELTMTELGAVQQLTVTVEPEDCTDKINWISSFPGIADVDDNGLVTAVAEGNVNILVTCGDYAASCMVTVDLTPEEETEESEETEDPAEQEEQDETSGEEEQEETEEDTAVALNYTDVTLFNPGEKLQLEVKNLPEGETVEWSSDSDVIVALDDTGLITATATGTCNVTATVGEQKFTCIVRCNLGTPPGEKIIVTLNQTDITMFYEGEQFRLEVGYTEEAPEDPEYVWTSSDEDVCTVDERGTVTAVAKGVATVTVNVDGVELKCTVRVNIEDAEETTTEEG